MLSVQRIFCNSLMVLFFQSRPGRLLNNFIAFLFIQPSPVLYCFCLFKNRVYVYKFMNNLRSICSFAYRIACKYDFQQKAIVPYGKINILQMSLAHYILHGQGYSIFVCTHGCGVLKIDCFLHHETGQQEMKQLKKTVSEALGYCVS